MTSDERLAEAAEILAAGISRLRARRSTSSARSRGETSLDRAADQSGHANREYVLDQHLAVETRHG
jgi:hypothetical protein